METLSSTIVRLTGRGFTAHFGVVGNRLRAFESGETFGAHEVIIRGYDRFEGVSDPDDMAIVYAIESQNGIRGSLVDAFGVYSDSRAPQYTTLAAAFQVLWENWRRSWSMSGRLGLTDRSRFLSFTFGSPSNWSGSSRSPRGARVDATRSR